MSWWHTVMDATTQIVRKVLRTPLWPLIRRVVTIIWELPDIMQEWLQANGDKLTTWIWLVMFAALITVPDLAGPNSDVLTFIIVAGFCAWIWHPIVVGVVSFIPLILRIILVGGLLMLLHGVWVTLFG